MEFKVYVDAHGEFKKINVLNGWYKWWGSEAALICAINPPWHLLFESKNQNKTVEQWNVKEKGVSLLFLSFIFLVPRCLFIPDSIPLSLLTSDSGEAV